MAGSSSRRLVGITAVVVVVAAVIYSSLATGGGEQWSGDYLIRIFRRMSEKLGFWAIPLYVSIHTVSLALCLPHAVFMEAGASLLFGFVPGVVCVFAAKLLGASLSFWIGRIVLQHSSSALEWAQRNKYFNLVTKGVARDGWKFVLLARFSPIPSYVINYTLAATEVQFFVDFLLPTAVGCIPMILQNTSIGSLAGAAVSSTRKSQKSKLLSYGLPTMGIASSILISLRIKKYSSGISDEQPRGTSNPVNIERKEN